MKAVNCNRDPQNRALLLSHEEHIPRPAAKVCAVRVINLCTIPKTITIPINAFRFFVVETDRINSKLRQCVKLAWLGDAIVI